MKEREARLRHQDQSEAARGKASEDAAHPTILSVEGGGEPGRPASEFLHRGDVPAKVLGTDRDKTSQRLTLRKLFLSPEFNRRDGLDDYSGDYRSFEPLGDVVTATVRHQMERLKAQPGESRETSRDLPEATAQAARGSGASKPGNRAKQPPQAHEAVHIPRARRPDTEPRGGGSHPPAPIAYRSEGTLLIIGPREKALKASQALGGRLPCWVLCDCSEPDEAEIEALFPPGTAVRSGKLSGLTGHLGKFHPRLASRDGEIDGAICFGVPGGKFDLILDLRVPPQLGCDLAPPGYYAPGEDAAALAAAIAELPDMVGEFEKPCFLEYHPSFCAHGRSGLQGCARCLAACPAGAITSAGDTVELDHHLCHGCGACATACPTGAIDHVQSVVPGLLNAARIALRELRERGDRGGTILLHREEDLEGLQDNSLRLPAPVLRFPVRQIGVVGLETWLSLLAFGASSVLLLIPRGTPPSVLREVSVQRAYAAIVSESLGYGSERFQLVSCDPEFDEGLTTGWGQVAPTAAIAPAPFGADVGKRALLRLAVEYLYSQAEEPSPEANLPDGAPFGDLRVRGDRCTLCMACAHVCPAQALHDGGGHPQLRLVETSCVQCGLCRAACPERCITLSPRLLFQGEAVKASRLLHEEEPCRCSVCGEAFASRSMVAKVMERLAGHWMFQEERAKRRLFMCKDCRVRDLFAGGG